jgi:catechol 2,3-dioxygenase-like lactoylglutathione lyase family enzyme
MKRVWPIIGVASVAGSNAWYQALFGQPPTPPAHPDFTQICDDDGTLLLALHEWAGHGEGPPLESPAVENAGNGVLLLFRVDDFDACLERARALVPKFETGPGVNEGTRTMAFSLRDPDGYYVTINSIS